jgi:transcriptional regulator with XRE-family HTH domain
MRERSLGLYPALLRHWRTRRGLSQLDFALAADVSARHVSFLETGRAQPSREMILRLGATLDVPLRDQNTMLEAAGFEAEYPEASFEGGLSPAIDKAIERMLLQQEPFPMVVMNRRYDVLRANHAAMSLLTRVVVDPTALGDPPNAMRLLFDPRLARPYLEDWERIARGLLSRLHREALSRPSDPELSSLLRALGEYPDVPEGFHEPDLSLPSEATLSFRLKKGELELGFLTTLTTFNAPQNVTLEELRIESYFPLDDRTTRECERMAED